jgi:hypothetical protein
VLTFQRLVHDFIFHQSGAADAGTKVAEAGVQFTSFPTMEYESKGFFDTIEGKHPAMCLHILVLCFVIPNILLSVYVTGKGPFITILGLLYPVASMIR